MDQSSIKAIEEDVAKQEPSVCGAIDLVGIEKLEMPIRVQQGSKILDLHSQITAMVSLSEENLRGIHMSRIYLSLHNLLGSNVLNLGVLKELLKQLIKSQEGISDCAYMKIAWKEPVKRRALKTDSLEGWRFYPVFYEGKLNKGQSMDLIMGLTVIYSSTCPCSASLTRIVLQEKFQTDFDSNQLDRQKIVDWLGKENSIAATPHAQKSCAFLKLKVKEEKEDFLSLVNGVEEILGTPVQTAVKKEDEKEFAKLNSQNLMFSEDAARRIKQFLNQKSWIEDFHIQVKHLESLHPFDVSCHLTKQVDGGWQV